MTTTKMETTEEEANNKSFSRVKELRSMFEESLTMCFEVKTIGVRLLLILFCILNFFVFFFPRVIACDVTLTFVACALSLSLSRRTNEQPFRNSRRSSRPCRKSTTSRCTIYTRNSTHPSKKNRGRNSSKL